MLNMCCGPSITILVSAWKILLHVLHPSSKQTCIWSWSRLKLQLIGWGLSLYYRWYKCTCIFKIIFILINHNSNKTFFFIPKCQTALTSRSGGFGPCGSDGIYTFFFFFFGNQNKKRNWCQEKVVGWDLCGALCSSLECWNPSCMFMEYTQSHRHTPL